MKKKDIDIATRGYVHDLEEVNDPNIEDKANKFREYIARRKWHPPLGELYNSYDWGWFGSVEVIYQKVFGRYAESFDHINNKLLVPLQIRDMIQFERDTLMVNGFKEYPYCICEFACPHYSNLYHELEYARYYDYNVDTESERYKKDLDYLKRLSYCRTGRQPENPPCGNNEPKETLINILDVILRWWNVFKACSVTYLSVHAISHYVAWAESSYERVRIVELAMHDMY